MVRGPKAKHERWIFPYRGNPVRQVTTKAWRKAAAKFGLEHGFRFHDLRHTWASWHAQDGTPLHVLQELGGWASPEMVQRYAHLATRIVVAPIRSGPWEYVPARTSPNGGNSICHNRRFLARYMPRLDAYFHYRNLDVSTLKELARRWKPNPAKSVV